MFFDDTVLYLIDTLSNVWIFVQPLGKKSWSVCMKAKFEFKIIFEEDSK